MTADQDSPLLDEVRARSLTHHVSILVGSSSAERVPSVVRAYGCRVAPDRRSITVFLAIEQSQAVLRDLRAGRGIAAVFSRPTTHETLQLKGAQADVAPLQDGDRALMRAYGESFRDELGAVGFKGAFGLNIISGTEADAVAVTFTPTAAFVQTPGPSAGQPLNAKP
jgi:hypothetical protein